MSLLFSPCAGKVVKVKACNGEKLFAVRFDSAGGELSFNAPITGFALEQNGNYQFLHTVDNFIYVYSFGDRIGELVVSGLGFINSCGADGSAGTLCDVYDFYQTNRLSQNGRMSVTLGTCSNAVFYAFLTGMRVELQDPKTLVGQWSLRFSVASKNR